MGDEASGSEVGTGSGLEAATGEVVRGPGRDPRTHPAFVLHAVLRSRRLDRALDLLFSQGWAPSPRSRLVAMDDLAAAVTEREVPRAGETIEPAAVREHAAIVDGLRRRGTVVPLPLGVTARDEDAVREFLARRRLPLLDALDFFEDCAEFRLHVDVVAGPSPAAAAEPGRHIYDDLRRHARAARILVGGAEREVRSAAFLVPLSGELRFAEEVRDWQERHPALRLRLTGPWAPWDFVRVVSLPAHQADRAGTGREEENDPGSGHGGSGREHGAGPHGRAGVRPPAGRRGRARGNASAPQDAPVGEHGPDRGHARGGETSPAGAEGRAHGAEDV